MRELTQSEVLAIMCAPDAADEPEEPDFVAEDAVDVMAGEMFVRKWTEKEMS